MNEIIEVTKTVKSLEDPMLNEKAEMSAFVEACKRDYQPDAFKEEKIVIKPDEFQLGRDTLFSEESISSLSFKISSNDVIHIIDQILLLASNPILMTSYLQETDAELGRAMEVNNIKFSNKDYPEFLITGNGSFVPGPPPEGYYPRKKNRLLDSLLLEHEQKNGINKEGYAPKFIGFISQEVANSLVASGYIFTEHKQISRLLLHGPLAHRLFFDAVSCAISKGKISLQCSDGKKLSFAQLLEMLIIVKFYPGLSVHGDEKYARNLWGITLDSASYSTHVIERYQYRCRSPFIWNSLLLCFGQELNLPNLQHYLLDSHWKGAYQMVMRVKQAGAENIPYSRIYTYCMEALSTTLPDSNNANVGIKLPFTIEETSAHANSSYEPFKPSFNNKNIVQKKLPPTVAEVRYAFWEQYLDRKSKILSLDVHSLRLSE